MKREEPLARRLAAIRERVARGEYVVSFTHTEKLRERKIGAEDLEAAIRNGVIVEDYSGPERAELSDPRSVGQPAASCGVRPGRSGADPDHHRVRAGPWRMGA